MIKTQDRNIIIFFFLKGMNVFEIINKGRIENGYTHKNLQRYKKYCNKMIKKYKPSNRDLSAIYRIESFFTKFLLFKSLRYLNKSIKLANKEETAEFKDKYIKYLKCFRDNEKGSVSIDDLVTLRHGMSEYYAFLDDIYNLADNRHDFDKYKINYKWHDITLLFETQKLLEDFLSNKFFLEDHRFNTQMAVRISRFENAKNHFITKLSDNNVQILDLFNSSNDFLNKSINLKNFLDDNFIESKYVNETILAIQSVHQFISKLLEYNNGIIEVYNYIEDFEVPTYFIEYKTMFNQLKNKKTVSQKKLKELLFSLINNRVEGDFRNRNAPLLPIFYDLAYEFIEYPKSDMSFINVFKNLNFFNKK